MVAEEQAFIHVLVSLAILLFAAQDISEIFHKFNLTIVLGELLAGIIVSPFALGGLPLLDGKPLVILNETVLQIGGISGIVILFIAGLEITPREFLKGGAASFTVGACGVIVPFFVGYYVFSLYGIGALQSVLVATALTATSIAISIRVLTELGKMQTREAKLILGAAIVDDHENCVYPRLYSVDIALRIMNAKYIVGAILIALGIAVLSQTGLLTSSQMVYILS